MSAFNFSCLFVTSSLCSRFLASSSSFAHHDTTSVIFTSSQGSRPIEWEATDACIESHLVSETPKLISSRLRVSSKLFSLLVSYFGFVSTSDSLFWNSFCFSSKHWENEEANCASTTSMKAEQWEHQPSDFHFRAEAFNKFQFWSAWWFWQSTNNTNNTNKRQSSHMQPLKDRIEWNCKPLLPWKCGRLGAKKQEEAGRPRT